ncbi:hypothetical protein B296_00007511 [Ensete ventricosum]|uniref:Cytochrome b5 heme-binding domain-containing protein n=1 Tax=Ensete ventricosum TaxID=4639 RepID=A0A426YWV3_ENSVE|nr:hypothetical protein B296_00007511 [Ensete ventricosum]
MINRLGRDGGVHSAAAAAAAIADQSLGVGEGFSISLSLNKYSSAWFASCNSFLALQIVASDLCIKKMADSKVYHFDEVSKHNVAKDCWLIIDGKVYDVTPFMDEHPGGDEVLLAVTDATNDFEDIGHSNSAKDLMAKYYVGQVDLSTVPTQRTYIPPQQPSYNPDKTSEFGIKILQFLVPIMILGLAFAVRHFTKAD